MVDMNGSAAAIRAGYTKTSARTTAARLLAKDNIISKVRELLDAQSKRTAVNADRVIEELARIAFINISEFIDEDNGVVSLKSIDREKTAAVEAIKVTETVYGRGDDAIVKTATSFKLSDKIAALDKLGRHFGIFEKDNRQSKPDAPVVKITMPDNQRSRGGAPDVRVQQSKPHKPGNMKRK